MSKLRFGLALVSLMAALPVLIPFSSLFMWIFTLVVGEYGHRLAIIPLLIALWSFRDRTRLGRTTLLFSLLAAGVFLTPLVTAARLAKKLPQEIHTAFGIQTSPNVDVLSWPDLWIGRAPTIVKSQSITFDETSKRQLLFFPARSDKPAPCLILLHSGGWENGSADEFPEWNNYWVGKGYAVASIDYRLAPKFHWPAPLEDVESALVYLKAHAAELGIDGQRFVFIGRSAGGQIATAAAYSLNDPTIRGCISLYGPADLVFAYRFADPKDVLDSPKLLRQYLGGTLEEVPDVYHSASGTLLAHKGSPPTLLVHGQHDLLVWHLQSRRLAAQLEQDKTPHYLLNIPWGTHGLDYPFHGPSSQLVRYASDNFLEHVFNTAQ